MSPSTFSLLLQLTLVIVEELLQELEPELLLVDSVTSISSEIILNSNNFAKSFNNNLRCLSQSFNKLAPVTHNWPR